MQLKVFTGVWLAVSLVVMFAFFSIYAQTRPMGVTLWRSIAKCGATFMAVSTAVFGVLLHNQSPRGWLLVLALVLCCVADFALERSFAVGVTGFALAHVVFIAYMLCTAKPVWGSLPIGLVLFVVASLLFWRELHALGGKGAAMLLYPAVLAAMTALAVALPFTVGPRYWFLAIGAAAFAVSDVFVAKDALIGAPDPERNGALLLYYLAVYAMACTELFKFSSV